MLPSSVIAWRDGTGAIDLVERGLIGTILLQPDVRLDCMSRGLEPADFSSPGRSAVYDVIQKVRHPDIALIALELERRGVKPPDGLPGWATALASTLDVCPYDDDAVTHYIDAIRWAAAERRVKARRNG